MIKPLPVDMLYRQCDPSALVCQTSDNAIQLDTIIGQVRAVKALRFGLDIKDKGFNIFVSGVPGTGRTTVICAFWFVHPSGYRCNRSGQPEG